jgi:hypothetical protein
MFVAMLNVALVARSDMAKLKRQSRRGKMKDDWANRPRMSKIAGAMYPSHLDPKTREEMIRANMEQEAGLRRTMSEGDRMYGKPSEPPKNYDHVPTFRRKVVKVTKSWWEK